MKSQSSAEQERGLLSLLPVFLLFFTPLAAQEQENEPGPSFSEEQIRSYVAEFRDDVEQQTGNTLPEEIDIRVVSREKLQSILQERLKPLFESLVSVQSEDGKKQYFRTFARNAAHQYLAFTDPGTRTLYYVPDNVQQYRDLMEMEETEVFDPDFFRVVTIHELVHVADAKTYAFTRRLQDIDSLSGYYIYQAVNEGHAQYVAEKIPRANNLGHVFNNFHDMFTSPSWDSENIPPAQLRLLKQLHDISTFGYRKGKNFWDHLIEQEVDNLPDRVFENPPEKLLQVTDPELYLHPSELPNLNNRAFIENIGQRISDCLNEKGYNPLQRNVTRVEIAEWNDPAGKEYIFGGRNSAGTAIFSGGHKRGCTIPGSHHYRCHYGISK